MELSQNSKDKLHDALKRDLKRTVDGVALCNKLLDEAERSVIARRKLLAQSQEEHAKAVAALALVETEARLMPSDANLITQNCCLVIPSKRYDRLLALNLVGSHGWNELGREVLDWAMTLKQAAVDRQ